jgi:hypothetical protein
MQSSRTSENALLGPETFPALSTACWSNVFGPSTPYGRSGAAHHSGENYDGSWSADFA